MKKVLTHLAACVTLVAAAGLPSIVSAAEPVRQLAGIELGADVQQARSQIEKAYPGYVYVEYDENQVDVPHKLQAWRKINPDATRRENQELDSIAIQSLNDGRVVQVSRAQAVAPGSMKESVLLESATGLFGKPTQTTQNNDPQWHVGQCRSINTRRIGVPGSTLDAKRFNLDKEVYLMTRFFSSFPLKCEYAAQLDYTTDDNGFVTGYVTTIMDVAHFAQRYEAIQKAKAPKPVGDASGTPKF